jgi:hypothetical protein
MTEFALPKYHELMRLTFKDLPIGKWRPVNCLIL